MPTPAKTLLTIPVYNEEKHVSRVLEEVRRYAGEILVIDDGSTDQTPLLLARQPVEVVRHAANRGYGQSMVDAVHWAQCYGYDWLITMDCDEQHEPRSLPDFYRAIQNPHADVVSGSRYLRPDETDDLPPTDRRAINATITQLVNSRLGLKLTDAFCGFKAYRVAAIKDLKLGERGYAFPLQFWVQAAVNHLRIVEVPVRLIYNDPNRSFGGPLDDPEHRLAHYRAVFDAELVKFADRLPGSLVPSALANGNGHDGR
jgi:dolichol-phosphate mannosyltransferase